MRFQPKSANDLYDLLPNGDYEFFVKKASHEISQNTNADMIKLELDIFYNGRSYIVFCYLQEAMLFLVKHFCDSVGLADKYESGTLTWQDCEKKKGACKIKKIDAKDDYRA